MQDMAKRARYFRKKGNSYYLNYRIPEDVRAHYEGRIHLNEKLTATNDRDAYQAAYRKVQHYEQEFRDVRRGLDKKALDTAKSLAPLASVTKEEIDQIIKIWFFEQQDKLFANATQIQLAEEDEEEDLRNNTIDELIVVCTCWLPGKNTRIGDFLGGDTKDEYDIARIRRTTLQDTRIQLLESHGIDPKSDLGSPLSDYMITTLRSAYQELAFRMEPILLEGVTSPKIHNPFFRQRPPAKQTKANTPEGGTKSTPGVTLKQVYDEFFADKVQMNGLEAKTITSYQSQLNFLLEVLGQGKEVQEIDYKTMLEVLNSLENYPVHAEKRYAKMTVKERIAHATKHLEADKKLSYTTIERYLTCYTRFFGYCIKLNYISGNNPATGIQPTIKKVEKPRDPFLIPHLNQLFSNPEYEKRFRIEPEAEDFYWVPLLALYTGFRLSECCQLHCDDIMEEGGIHYIGLIEDDEAGEGMRRLKTEAAVRRVPIHPELKRLGFLNYWDTVKKQNTGHRLFPNIKYSNSKAPYRSMQRRFSNHLQNIGLKEKEIERNYVFHSFRHTASSSLINNGMDENSFLHNCLLGWGNKGMRANYSKPSIEKLYETVQKIQYPGLDLSHLYKR